MFPCVIAALPPLPPELQYRIVGDTLVLIDVHASLIVDLLPRALVETTIRCGSELFPGPLKIPRHLTADPIKCREIRRSALA